MSTNISRTAIFVLVIVSVACGAPVSTKLPPHDTHAEIVTDDLPNVGPAAPGSDVSRDTTPLTAIPPLTTTPTLDPVLTTIDVGAPGNPRPAATTVPALPTTDSIPRPAAALPIPPAGCAAGTRPPTGCPPP